MGEFREVSDKETIGVIVVGIAYCLFAVLIIFKPRIDSSRRRKEASQAKPLSRTPIIPFPQDELKLFEGTEEFPNLIPEAKLLLSYERQEKLDVFPVVITQMNMWMERLFDLNAVTGPVKSIYELKKVVPLNTKTISIKMEGFEHGEMCHDFEPIGGAAPGSYYTYQMYGDNAIQVTNYVEGGVSYVAGCCIYISNLSVRSDSYNGTVYDNCVKSEKYPGRAISETSENSRSFDMMDDFEEEEGKEVFVLDCSKLQRKVMCSMVAGGVVHQEWDSEKKEMKKEECGVCTKKHLKDK